MLFVQGVGSLGRDPEITTIQGKNGPVKKATFSVAFNRPFGDEVDWVRCEILGKRADTIEQYFHKGSEIEIFGRPESYKSQKDNHIYWTVKILDFAFTGGTNRSRDGAQNQPKQAQTQPAPVQQENQDTFEDIDDDVPF